MTVQPLVKYPNSLLRQVSVRVTSFDAEFQILVDDLIETMLQQGSMGLAAPQIGVSRRVCVLNRRLILGSRGQKNKANDIVCIVNPEIQSEECIIDSSEGCLSIPQQRGVVKRFQKIQLKALDRNGSHFSLAAEGMLSIVIQHEIDHFDGILFIDKLAFPHSNSQI
ncbi:MAG: peptide deformylase [Scytonema sp. PMC 1069.18]|nr:peptide deformylase [Scytonema sp. PMC 1069.18]MEC4881622.1 peptide deformylase [Scytonema sp. PMC 1070.18]